MPSLTHIFQNGKMVMGLLCFIVFLLAPLSSSHAIERCNRTTKGVVMCLDETVYNIILSVAQSEQDKIALINIFAKENSGRRKPSKHLNSDGTYDWGVMQINDKNLLPRGGSWGCQLRGEDLMTDDPTNTVKCSYYVFKRDSKKCQTFEAALCAYNKGIAWCTSWGRVAKGCDDYSTIACNMTGTDCKTGIVGTNPHTGESNIAIMESSADENAPLVVTCMNLGLAQAMEQASKAYQGVAITSGRTIFEQAVREDMKETGKISPITGEPVNKYLRGKIKYSYCLDVFLSYFDIIKQLMSIGNMIAAAIAAIVTTILNYACQFVANAINNVLSMMCLPLPSLNIGLNFALSSNRQSCDGLSLSNLISVNGNSPLSMPTTVPGYFTNMSRGITDPRTGHIRF